MSNESRTPTGLREAVTRFALADPNDRPGERIRALRRYVACRLVIEGGFHPDRIRPRPPICEERNRRGVLLRHDADAANPGRRTLLGGLTTRRVDVTVTVPDIGLVLAVLLKGTHDGTRTPYGRTGGGRWRLRQPPHGLSSTGLRLLARREREGS